MNYVNYDLDELKHDLIIEKESWENVLKLQKENFIELLNMANSKTLVNLFEYPTISQMMKIAQRIDAINIELSLIERLKEK